MTPQIALVLVVLVVSLILFATERFPSDVIGLGIVVTLVVTGLLPMRDAFAGFGSDTVLMILGLLIMTAALLRTGVVDTFGRALFRVTGDQPKRILTVIMVSAATLGSFMSHTAATALLLPIVLGIANRARISVAKLLMPLAFATILASGMTLIATSTNLVVSGLMTQYGMQPLGIFELTPIGVPILIVGLIYMYFIGDRLIPDRTPVGVEKQRLSRIYLTEMVIAPDSALVGKTLAETRLGSELDIQVLRIVRDKHRYLPATASTILEAGDVLLVEAGRSQILKVKDTPGVEIKADFKFSNSEVDPGDIGIFDVILVPGSPFIGRTLRGLDARERYNLQVLAINRHGEPIRGKLSNIRMQLGDILLIQGDRDNIEVLEQDATFTILDAAVDHERPDLRRAPRAVLIFVGALVLSALEIVPIPVAALGGAVAAFVTRCITPEEAYRQVEWKVLILIGSMLALGQAIEKTGTAAFLAQQIVAVVGHMPVFFVLSAFFVLTVVLTQPLSNQAAAAVVLPVAVRTALQLDLDPRTFAVLIALAASSGFLTPLEPACVIIYGPGRYRFMDFVKVGALLTVVIYLIVILLVPILWSPIPV